MIDATDKSFEMRPAPSKPIRVLIPFNTVSLYGMERSVIELFDLLRPEVEPHFLLTLTTRQLNLPVLAEIERRGLSHSFFSDKTGWPKIGRPKSAYDAWRMAVAMMRGNLDVFKAAVNKDIIYIPSISYFFFALLASFRHRLRRRRLIYHFHDLLLRKSRRLHFVGRFVTDFVHNTQFGLQEIFKNNGWLNKKRNWVIPLSIQMRTPSDGNGKQDVKWGKGQNVVYVGQISKHKGVDLLIQASALLEQSHPKATFHLVGGCHDVDFANRVGAAVRASMGRIRHWEYRDDVLDLMKIADVHVHPSPPSRVSESFGRGVVEAMSVGTPTICFGSGALQEIVENEITGLICEEETATCLAQNISRLLGDANLRETCGNSARARFQRNYSETRVKSLWMQLLNQPSHTLGFSSDK